ncbi:hypothetical protein G7Y89_g3614 [Cudoniella acicularis]|uniref:Short-chain dehydrogenase n=1 Tax=Cudoniella acicularis TaxID=354080 RepID=A0A8H4W874_9HELO|nr:hypothetical protein G7Y89_g3614 [Cudoniella acicularis]
MSRYAPAHVNPQGPGDDRPTALQIVKDEDMENRLKGKVIIITGTSSGIGMETARALSATSATLFLTARDLTKAKEALTGILEPGRIELVEMDLTSFTSVRSAAKTILEKSNNQVNILINNAGVMAIADLQLTQDGNEIQFGTNHLAHFLLFQLLKPALLASSTPEFNSRVVNLTSSGHRLQRINESDNYSFQKGDYNPWTAYAQSKTANIYMANEIDRRYAFKGLHATSVHPGAIMTHLQKHVDPAILAESAKNDTILMLLKSVEQGAATTTWAAVGKEWEGKGGRYLANCAEEMKGKDDGDMWGVGYVSHTYDPKSEGRLWKDSLKIVGLEDDL